MSRTTIDYGIDLGTTNSSISCVDPGSQPIAIDNLENERITPSAVAFAKKGNLLIGRQAYNLFRSHRKEDIDNLAIQFKRRMGTSDTYFFPYTDQKFKAENLSAEILKELRSSVERKRGERIDAAVITVPAAFEQPQIAATKRAAELAGFTYCELLLEPVAASLAYGFQEKNVKGYWLVYDFGGGTFDAALMQFRDGIARIVNHSGDNYLGGLDIDYAILDQIILSMLAENHDLSNFNRGEERWKYAVAKLRYLVEMAKINLSKSESTDFTVDYVYDPDIEDKIYFDDFDHEITREAINPVIEPIIIRSINHVKDLLKQSDISPVHIEKMILVGGPTQYYLFREAITSELGIPLDFHIDPMTVVAQGASVFASMRARAVKTRKPAKENTTEIELKYDPSGSNEEHLIGGKVHLLKTASAEKYSIELIHTRTKWRSGKIPLDCDGTFEIRIQAESGVNEYEIELTNDNGTLCNINPEALVYSLVAIEAPKKTLMHSIMIGQADGSGYFIFPKGAVPPLQCRYKCQPDHRITKDTDDALMIKIFEGDNSGNAAHNHLIGELILPANEMPRDIHVNADIEATIKLDENGNFAGTVEILHFDREPYPIQWITENIYGVVNLDDLQKQAQKIQKQLYELSSSARQDSYTIEFLERTKAEDAENQIEAALQAAQIDKDAASKCLTLILELYKQLDHLEARNARPKLIERAKKDMTIAKELINKLGSDKYDDPYNNICHELNEAMHDPNVYRLEHAAKELHDFINYLYREDPEAWIYWFKKAEEKLNQMTDQRKAGKLLNQGRKSIEENDIESLKSMVRQLYDLLPDDEKETDYSAGNIYINEN